MTDFPHSPTGTIGLQKSFGISIRKVFRNALRDVYSYLDKQKTPIKEQLVLTSKLDDGSINFIENVLEKIKLDLSSIVKAYLAGTWWKANNFVARETNLGEWVNFDKRVLKSVQDNSYSFLYKYVDGKQDDLREILREGISQGDTAKTIAAEIKESFKMTSWKSEQIARTEVIRTHSKSTMVAIRNGGVTKEIKWLTSRRENVCPACLPLHGRVFNIDDPNTPVPPIHPNCSCGVIPEVKI